MHGSYASDNFDPVDTTYNEKLQNSFFLPKLVLI